LVHVAYPHILGTNGLVVVVVVVFVGTTTKLIVHPTTTIRILKKIKKDATSASFNNFYAIITSSCIKPNNFSSLPVGGDPTTRSLTKHMTSCSPYRNKNFMQLELHCSTTSK